jgi:hypothetical protein
MPRVVANPTDIRRRGAGQHVQVAGAIGCGASGGDSVGGDGLEAVGGCLVGRPTQSTPGIEDRNGLSPWQQRSAELRMGLEPAPRVRRFPGALGPARASL